MGPSVQQLLIVLLIVVLLFRGKKNYQNLPKD